MKTESGGRFALMTMGLGMVAGATGFAALRDDGSGSARNKTLPILMLHNATSTSTWRSQSEQPLR
jgi:hypothetical protein